jgi:hypothetical protein
MLHRAAYLAVALAGRAAAQTCDTTTGCSPLSHTSVELADGIWICGNSDTTGSWTSIWSMCNECNNYALPTISSLSLRMQPQNPDSWIAASSWTTATTQARRDGFEFVMAGQPAGGYSGGGWTSVINADAGQQSSLSLAQIRMARGIRDSTWVALTDGSEDTDMSRGDSSFGSQHQRPAAEFDTDGQRWVSLCIDASPYEGTYMWHHMWRKTVCTSGLTIEHSDVVCAGNLGALCEYTCAADYHVYGSRPIEGSVAEHQHECVYDESGTYGMFTGGLCVPDVCETSHITHSPSVCDGSPLEECDYECDPGYARVGEHVCNLQGIFEGGACEPIQCTQGLTIENSDTVCAGYTGDECEYECLDGYIPGAEHLCRPGGRFYGGFCTAPLSCDGIEWGPKRNDTCGECGGDNSTCSGCDGQVYSSARWDSCGICGGNYAPSVTINMGDSSDAIGVRSSQELSIPTTAFWNSSCPSTSSLAFLWSTEATVENGNLLQPLDARTSRSPTLRLPAGTLVAGKEITLKVRVTAYVAQGDVEGSSAKYGLRSVSTRDAETAEPPSSVCIQNPLACPRELVSITDWSEASIRINCVREPVQAVIAGGNRVVPRQGAVVLDASGSLDPQLSPEPFEYMWNCTKTGTTEACPSMGWRWVPEIHPPNDPILSIAAESLEASTSYDFRVTVTKVSEDGTKRNDTAMVTITVAAGMVPSVNINQRDIRPKYNSNERLVISGVVSSNLIPHTPPNEPGGEEVVLLWRGFARNTTGYFLPMDMTMEGFLSTPVSSRNLVVSAFNLDPGSQYRFRLTGTGSDGDATAEVDITMNLSPVDGICRARCRTNECTSMREGMAIRDQFTLSALDWVDEDEGPLWYRFGYNDATGQQFFVTDFSMSESVQAIIPAGNEETVPPFSVFATCDIRDLYGGTASDTDRITVMPYEVEGSLADAAGGMLGEAASSGDTQQSFQLVDAFAGTLNDDGNRRRRYRRRMTEEEVVDDAIGARAILVDTLSDMTTAGAVVGAAGRVASSLSAVSSNPGELTSDATDKSLSTVSSITESDEKLGGDAVVGFASAAANLLKSSKGQFEEARRRRRLSEGNETAGASPEELAAAAERGNAVRNIVSAVAVGSNGDKVAGEAATVIETSAFGLETSREEPSDMEGKQLAGGVAVPSGFLPEGFAGSVDSQVTSWKGDDHPFFFAGSGNESNATLSSEVQSVSFNSGDGAEIPVNGLTDPFVVNISVPGGMWCPENTSAEFLGEEDACVEEEYNCSYFDDATGTFVIDGEEINRTNYTITCAFYHLTDLASVAGPKPSTNKMDFDKMMSADFLMNNPVGFALACGLLMLLIYSFWWSIKEYIKETNEEGVTVNNASMMQTEFALNQCNYKVDKISFKQRVIVKIRMDWDWGGLFFPMPGDPNSRSQRALVLLAATLFTLVFEIMFFKDPAGCINFTEGQGKQKETYQYDCLSGSKDPSLTAEEAFEICDDQLNGRLFEVCDPICNQFQANGYMAALLAALCSIPFSKSMGYAFGWLQEPYSAVIEGDDAAPPGRLQRWWNRCTRGKEFKKEIAAMEKHPEDRSDAEIELLCQLMHKCELFEGVMSMRDRREIARVLTYKAKRPHTIIWEQGDMGKEVHSILRGNVTVMVTGPDGESRAAGIINEGSYYGEKAFDHDNLRTAGIQTTDSPVELLVVVGEKLDMDVLDRLVDSITGADDSNVLSAGAVAGNRWRAASKKLGVGAALAAAAGEAAQKRDDKPSLLGKSFRSSKKLGDTGGIAALMKDDNDSEEESERSSSPPSTAGSFEKSKTALLGSGDIKVLQKDKEMATRPDDYEHDALQIRPQDLLMSASFFMPQPSPGRSSPSRPVSAWDDPEEVRGSETSSLTSQVRSDPARQHWNKLADEVLGVEDVLPGEELGAAPTPPMGAPPVRRKRRPVNPWKDIISDVRNARSTGAIDTTGSQQGSALGVSVMGALAARQAGSGKEVDPSAGGDGKEEVPPPHRKLTVIGAVNLRNADRFIGKSDPYAVVHWNGCRVGQTKIVKDSLDPRWKAEFDLEDSPPEKNQAQTELKITVWDHDFDRDDFLGQATYMITNGEVLTQEQHAKGVETPRELFNAKELTLQNHELKKKAKKSKQATGYVIIDLKEGHDTRERMVRRRRTPMHDAACRGEHKKLVYLIDEAGWLESIDDKDPERGWTALHYAVFKGYKNCVRVLLQFTCDVNVCDDYGWTPLMEAAWSGRCKSVLWMLGAGASMDDQDKDGWTALHAAAHQGNFGCATALIDAGADRIVPDNSGQNAAMVAEGRKYIALGHLIMFGTQDARRRKPVHAAIIFSYAFLMGLGSVVIVAATTAAFTMERTIKWLTATAMSLFLAMFIFDPIKIVLFGPVVHHLQAILKHKKAVGFLGFIVATVAMAHDIKETFCPTSL